MRFSKLKTLIQQDFVRHNLTFLVGTLAIAVFSYLYYPVIGHLVPVVVFGEVQAWISLFMEFGIILTAFGYVITNIVNNHEEKAEKTMLLVEVERLALLISVIVFLLLWAASYYLRSSLQFSSSLPFIALGALIVLNVPATARTYFLQGEKRLKSVALGGIVFAAGKLVLSAVLVVLGFKLFGVVMGYIVAQAANLYYVAYKTKGRLPSLRSSVPLNRSAVRFKTARVELRRELLYGLFILVLLAVVTVLYTSDAIIVRRYFTANQAGLFSGISSVARIVFFVTASVAGVLIASVKMKESRGHNVSILTKSLLLVVGIGGLVLAAFILLPDLAIRVLIGGSYRADAYLLPWLGVSMLLASLNNLLFSYQIALRQFRTLYAALAGIVALVALVVTKHQTLKAVVVDYTACNALIFLITCKQIYLVRSAADE